MFPVLREPVWIPALPLDFESERPIRAKTVLYSILTGKKVQDAETN
jgi:hypothetical protein